jgi:Flp pilus assembly protein TadD
VSAAALSNDARTAVGLLAHIYMENNRPAKAEILLTALAMCDGGDPGVLPRLAWAQLSQDKAHEALATLERMAMTAPADAIAHLLRAQALTALSRIDEARQAMQTYVQARAIPRHPKEKGPSS